MLALLALIFTGSNVWSQTDVTATYLTNADFAQGPVTTVNVCGYQSNQADAGQGSVIGLQDVSGWKFITTANKEGTGGAVFAYGSGLKLWGNQTTPPATSPDGTATGNALGYFAAWRQSTHYYQDVTLPAGDYTIAYRLYNASGAQTPQRSFFGFIPNNGTAQVVAPNQLVAVGQWVTRTVTFTLTEQTAGKIAVGYQAIYQGAAENPHLYIDKVTIYNSKDMTGLIQNPSFEDYGPNNHRPWQRSGSDVTDGTSRANSGVYTTNGTDGNYLFNIWGGNVPTDYFQVQQTLSNLPAGQYVLQAKIATDNGHVVDFFAGDQRLYTQAPVGGGQFTDYTIHFNVESQGTSVPIGMRSETTWFKVDDFRLFQVTGDDATPESNLKHFETTGDDWTVNGSTATFNTQQAYYIDKDDKYLVVKATGIGTDIGATTLTTLNQAEEGHYPTFTYKKGDDVYLVWEFDASRYSVWGTMGDNLYLGTSHTQLTNRATAIQFTGTPAIGYISTFATLPNDVVAAQRYCQLQELIAAANELNTRLDDEPTLAAAIEAAEAVAANTTHEYGTYDNARLALLAGIRAGLKKAATEVDVTDIYIRNNSFETGWASHWTPNANIQGDQNSVKKYDLWGRDGAYIYNQWQNPENIQGSILQNLTDLAAGRYKATATVCGANGSSVSVYLSQSGTRVASSANSFENNHDGVTITTDMISVGDNGSLQIGLSTSNTWFRVDNFRLTYEPTNDEVDKTDLRRMIMTAQNLKELGTANGEGYDPALGNLQTYIELANDESATHARIEDAIASLRTIIQTSYANHNAQHLPTASAPGQGNYYLYNVATKSYLNVGSLWGTRAIAGDYRGEAGTLLTLAGPKADGGYTMNTKQLWGGTDKWLVALTGNGVWIDGDTNVQTYKKRDEGGAWEGTQNTWAEMPWLFEPVPGFEADGSHAGANVFRLYRTSGDKRDYGMEPGTRLKRVMSLDRDKITISTIDADGALNELYSYWILVSEADRINMLNEASFKNPVNASFLIKNPDLEGQNAQAAGTADNNYATNGTPQMLPLTWTFSGTGGASSQVGNANGSDVIGDRAIETFNSSTFTSSQTITLPKKGLYRLRVNGFYRPGDKDSHSTWPGYGGTNGATNPLSTMAADLQHRAAVTMNPALYAGDQEVPLMSINTGDNGTNFQFGLTTTDKTNVGGFLNNARYEDLYHIVYYDYGHVPDNVAAATERSRELDGEGRYSDNSLLVYASADNQTVTIGVKKDARMANDWTFFDHFNLWYLGEGDNSVNQQIATAYNNYRKARIDAITYLFDTYHHTELRDTAYTRYLNTQGFDLTTNYGSPRDPWTEGDPKGTVVFAEWLKKQLADDDAILQATFNPKNTFTPNQVLTRLQGIATDLDYDVTVAELGYQMAEFYFFSRGVQEFYADVKDPGSYAISSEAGAKDALLRDNEVESDLQTLQLYDAQALNTLKKAMGISGVDDSYVLNKAEAINLINTIKTTYGDRNKLKPNEIVKGNQSRNTAKEAILQHVIPVAQGMNPSARSEFDLTFMLPRADVVGLENWDWLPIFEWLSNDNPSENVWNYDVHTGNNKYQGHDAYFAEKWRPTGTGIDAERWAIYQSVELPAGLYRFAAATFARAGNEDSDIPAENAYIAINLADASNNDILANAEKLYNIELQDRTAIFRVTDEIVTDKSTNHSTVKLNVGMYNGPKGENFSSWIGMSQMRLYKIPQATISEDKVYRPHMSPDRSNYNGSEGYFPETEDDTTSDEYKQNPYIFNFSEVAEIIGVRRTFSTGKWLSLTFPFDMTRQEFCKMLGINNVIVNQFKGSKVNDYGYPEGYVYDPADPNPPMGARVDLYFEREEGDYQDYIHAHVPCIVFIPETETIQPFNAVKNPTTNEFEYYDPGTVRIVKRSEPATTNPDGGDFSFDAIYAGVNVGFRYASDGTLIETGDDRNDLAGSYLPEEAYFFSGGRLKYVPRKADYEALFGTTYKPVKTKGLRAFFNYHGGSQQVKDGNILSWTYEFDTATGIDRIEVGLDGQVIGRQIGGRDVTGVYNMNGQRIRKDASLEGLAKGVYIVNGRKQIVK